MSIPIKVKSGKATKLLTAGKYCDRDVVVTTDCVEKHFVHNFVGDGSDTATFHLPFEPDEIQVFGFDPTVINTGYLMAFSYDLRAFGICAGYVYYGNSKGGATATIFSDAKAKLRYSRTEDGTATVKGIGASNAVVNFGAGFPYTVAAVKYVDKSDKERITDFVNRLTGSGTASLQQAKVNAAFTDDEWAALIATKPNWTFTMI